MFKSIRTDRMSQAIVDQIKEAIFQKKIKIGERLPPERQLIDQFQTSRVTLREALKMLEISGILEIRRGTQGGAFVRDPDVRFVRNFLQDMFHMGRIGVSDLTEARLAVEPFAVKTATERINEALLAQVAHNIDETKECLVHGQANDARLLTLEYHRLIAQASGNPVIFFMVDSIIDIMEHNVSAIPIATDSISNTLRYHETIYEAIRSGDPMAAQHRMLRHIQAVQKVLETPLLMENQARHSTL